MVLGAGPPGQPRTSYYAGRAEARQPFVALPLARRCEPHSPFPLGIATSLGRHPLTALLLARSALPPVDARGVLLSDQRPCLVWPIPAFGAAFSPFLEERHADLRPSHHGATIYLRPIDFWTHSTSLKYPFWGF